MHRQEIEKLSKSDQSDIKAGQDNIITVFHHNAPNLEIQKQWSLHRNTFPFYKYILFSHSIHVTSSTSLFSLGKSRHAFDNR